MSPERPPMESPEPLVKFALIRLVLMVTALGALVVTGFPFQGRLTALIAGVGLPWALGLLLLSTRRPRAALNPWIPAGDLAFLTLAELAAPATYGATRLFALFLVAAHAQFQGQRRALVIAVAAVALLVPMAILEDTPVTGSQLVLWESIFVVTAIATALISGNVRLAETTGRLRARDVTRRTIEAERDVRRSLAESIHDGPVQELVSLDLILAALERAQARGDGERVRTLLAEARTIASRNVEALRDEIVGLGPYAFEELSFDTAVSDCAPTWRRRYEVDVELRIDCLDLSSDVTGALFQITQEAVANAGRHAHASRVVVALGEHDGGYELLIADDGRGFGGVSPLGVTEPGHIGLASMRERAELVDGELSIETGDDGTEVRVRLPR